MFVAKRFFKSQRGDTMVEVLIAIAVITVVLGGAYVVTNRSLSSSRSAQERSIALKLGESQIERIKGMTATTPDLLFGGSAPSPFCISSAGAVVVASNVACAMDTSGAATTIQPVFHISITRTNNDFVLTETWADVGGRGDNTLQLRYRVYE